MYFMIGTGVLAVTTVLFAREAWKLHKKLVTTEKVLNRRMMDVAAVTHQRDENKKKINRTEVALGKVKISLKKAEEKVIILEGEKERITKEITTVKNTVQEARTEINSLKIDKEDLEKKLEKLEEVKDKLTKTEDKLKLSEKKVEKIRTMGRAHRAEYLANGFKNINFFKI
ncbi:MAG: hypothetical protein ACRCYA_03085 [Cetobacterium sp.]|uniref:hypothetical protein n=1 Tax=Cetobacterium sp. TaxID=2071632 RepID=UPI003F38C3F8